jgi:hypothetical protein
MYKYATWGSLAVVKSCLLLHFKVVICTFKCWKLNTAQTGAGGGVKLNFFHYPSCTESIKPSLQFLCNFDVYNASEGSHFYLFTRYLYISTEGVKCCIADVKSCPVLHFSVVIFSCHLFFVVDFFQFVLI